MQTHSSGIGVARRRRVPERSGGMEAKAVTTQSPTCRKAGKPRKNKKLEEKNET